MDISLFSDPKRFFCVTLFLDNDTLNTFKKDLESLGTQKNVKLVVQPCPYEAIEFLYQISDELVGHHRSMEKEVFWEAMELKYNTPKKIMEKIAAAHHQYLTSILEQRIHDVKKNAKLLTDYAPYFISPIERTLGK